MVITGSTRVYAVLGDPVTQVRAPELMNTFFAGRGTDAVLVPVHARSEDLTTVVHGLQRIANVDGLLFTVPHKAAAAELADRRSTAVTISRSANVMRRESDGAWYAETFDGTGFVRGLLAAGHDPSGTHTCLVGAGGAGSAIAPALLTAGVAHLSLHDLDADRVRSLAGRLLAHWPGRVSVVDRPALTGVEVIVNATPLGLAPSDPLPFDPAGLAPGTLVADVIMKPPRTPLLDAAAALGLPTQEGRHMLDHQVEQYEEFFAL